MEVKVTDRNTTMSQIHLAASEWLKVSRDPDDVYLARAALIITLVVIRMETAEATINTIDGCLGGGWTKGLSISLTDLEVKG